MSLVGGEFLRRFGRVSVSDLSSGGKILCRCFGLRKDEGQFFRKRATKFRTLTEFTLGREISVKIRPSSLTNLGPIWVQ